MAEDKEFKHVCKFCSKRFPCGRSLGGHMRSHMVNDITSQSDGTKITKKKLPSLKTYNELHTINNKIPNKTWSRIGDHSSTVGEEEEEDTSVFVPYSKTNTNSFEIEEEEEEENTYNEKRIVDSQSDNETVTATAAVPYKRRRSKRKTRYARIATNSSNSFSSASEIEQEEVAMCLIMLSMDKGAFNTVATDSSVLSSKIEGVVIPSVSDEASDVAKFDKKTEFSTSGIELGKNLMKENSEEDLIRKSNSSKREFCESIEAEFGLEKSNKFECTTCNKIFCSYQALGGHKASHKKIKVSSDIEQICKPNPLVSDEIGDGVATGNDDKEKKSKGHECPICFKVFQSGQALGGHKRSHLVNANANANVSGTIETKNTQDIIEIRQEPNIPVLFDLNLPAATDEEESNEVVGFNNSWWISRSSHEHETLVGLI